MDGIGKMGSPCVVLGVGDAAIPADAAAAEVACSEWSSISKGYLVLSCNLHPRKGIPSSLPYRFLIGIGLNFSREILNVDLGSSDMTCTFGLTITWDVLYAACRWLDKEIDNAEVITYCIVLQLREIYSSPCYLQLLVNAFSFCVYNTCYANNRSNTANLDTAADVAVTEVDWTYGNMLNAVTVVIDVAGYPLQTLCTDQLADAKGGLMADEPCEITYATECTCPLELQSMLKEDYVDHYKLSDRPIAMMFTKVSRVKKQKPVSSSEIVAEFGGSAYSKQGSRTVNPFLRASNESGACCLCRYLYLRYLNEGHGLVSSYVLCQGKDIHIVSTWSFPITSCDAVCGQDKKSSSVMSNPGQKNHPVAHVHGIGNKVFKIPWIFVSMAFCVMLLIFLWYMWWSKQASNSCQPQSPPLNRSRGFSSEGDPWNEHRRSSGRRLSAQLKDRRMSYS
uniref:Uncharacterized protein n=1 Tax=Leersia perrieri TaxID=77586 RepID=A0A0D9XX05_9ORYZ